MAWSRVSIRILSPWSFSHHSLISIESDCTAKCQVKTDGYQFVRLPKHSRVQGMGLVFVCLVQANLVLSKHNMI